jgi:hypothetical protein
MKELFFLTCFSRRVVATMPGAGSQDEDGVFLAASRIWSAKCSELSLVACLCETWGCSPTSRYPILWLCQLSSRRFESETRATRCQRTSPCNRRRSPHWLAHVPAHLHDSATREWRRCEGRAGTVASWVVADHDGRVRPGSDAGQAQGAGESGCDAAGRNEGDELKIIASPVCPRRKTGSPTSLWIVGVPDGI